MLEEKSFSVVPPPASPAHPFSAAAVTAPKSNIFHGYTLFGWDLRALSAALVPATSTTAVSHPLFPTCSFLAAACATSLRKNMQMASILGSNSDESDRRERLRSPGFGQTSRILVNSDYLPSVHSLFFSSSSPTSIPVFTTPICVKCLGHYLNGRAREGCTTSDKAHGKEPSFQTFSGSTIKRVQNFKFSRILFLFCSGCLCPLRCGSLN